MKMKITHRRILAGAMISLLSTLATNTPVLADPIHASGWIPAHKEWMGGHDIQVDTYYCYPRQQGNHWVLPSYTSEEDGYFYHPGYWSN